MTAGSFDLAQIISTQRELFYRLDEFFRRATGEAAMDFSSPENFAVEIKRKAQTIAPRAPDAFRYAWNELRQFYEKQSASTPNDIGSMVAGHKLLLGGSTRFLGSHIDAVRGALFWTDTVFIRDPVLPWLETDRRDERFAKTLMLQAAHSLLHLREFADADASCPPIIVYPAWEKIREDKNKNVQKAIENFISRFLTKHLGVPLNSLDEAMAFAKANRSRFFEVVQAQRLYIPPGGSVGMTVDAALEHWRTENATWRTQEHMSHILSLPAEGQLFLALAERLRPQFHTTNSAIALGAQPLFCIEQQAHYFKLSAQVEHDKLSEIGMLDKEALALIDALASKEMRWLSGAPADALIHARQTFGNVAFRKRLQSAVSGLHEARLVDLKRVTAEITHEINQIISEHNKQLTEIDEKYSNKHAVNAIAFAGSLAINLYPSLSSILGPALPFVVGLNAVKDLSDHDGEKERLCRSLVGVLATTRLETA